MSVLDLIISTPAFRLCCSSTYDWKCSLCWWCYCWQIFCYSRLLCWCRRLCGILHWWWWSHRRWCCCYVWISNYRCWVFLNWIEIFYVVVDFAFIRLSLLMEVVTKSTLVIAFFLLCFFCRTLDFFPVTLKICWSFKFLLLMFQNSKNIYFTSLNSECESFDCVSSLVGSVKYFIKHEWLNAGKFHSCDVYLCEM